jgi:light-regulated signal transduction histidine kinase (bacteriophytochrome)
VEQLEESIQKYNGQVLTAELPTIQSSNSLLFTTLKNLIENGLKYNKSDKPTVEIDYHKTETHHEIIISDNGIGINKQYHAQVFKMFKRLHNRGAYEGSGIGLAIVKLSADKLGGKVLLESEEGKGSRFVIQLPL